MASGLQGFRASGLQGFRASGLQGDGRDIVLDSLRGFAIILVVIGHAILGFWQSGEKIFGSSLLNGWIYSFHMPFFFMISGYAEGMKIRAENVLRRLKKCAADLYLPCLCLSFLLWLPRFIMPYVALSNTENFRHASLASLFVLPFGLELMWFLFCLFCIKSIHILIEHFTASRYFPIVFWTAAFAVYLFFPYGACRFMYYGLYFYIGLIIKRQNIITQDNAPKTLYGIILLLAGALLFSARYAYGLSNIFTGELSALCTSLAMFVIFYSLNVKNSLLSLCGVHSMVIYVCHSYTMSAVRIIYRMSGLYASVNTVMLLLFSCSAGVFIPLCIVLMYKNVKCLRWIEYIFYPGKLLRK